LTIPAIPECLGGCEPVRWSLITVRKNHRMLTLWAIRLMNGYTFSVKIV